MKKKIVLIGAGQIGGTMALLCTQKELGDVVTIDINEGIPQGKSLDLLHGLSLIGSSTQLIGSNTYDEIEGADVVIITAGLPRKPGMSRDDLLEINLDIIRTVAEEIKEKASNAFIIVITNPLDAMVYAMQRITEFDSRKVIGMAGVLDSARFASLIASEINVNPADVRAMVMGGHGDTMVPLIRYATVNGIPVTQFLSNEKLQEIATRTAKSGGEVVSLLKTGSAFYSPALSAIHMAEAYLKDKRSLLPCAVQLNGEYGINGLYCGVPAIIGMNGVEKIVEVNLDDQEKKAFNISVDAVKEMANWINQRIS